MIERKLAEQIKVSVLTCVRQLDESVKDAVASGPNEHSSMYRRLVGQVLGQLFTAVLSPIYEAYPDLEPEDLRKARQEVHSSGMSRETCRRLMGMNTTALKEMDQLRASLAKLPGVDARVLESGLQKTIESIRSIQEFLFHVCPEPSAAE